MLDKKKNNNPEERRKEEKRKTVYALTLCEHFAHQIIISIVASFDPKLDIVLFSGNPLSAHTHTHSLQISDILRVINFFFSLFNY